MNDNDVKNHKHQNNNNENKNADNKHFDSKKEKSHSNAGNNTKELIEKLAKLNDEIKSLNEKCESLSKEKDEIYNKMLLVKADSENYKKRVDKDKEDTIRLANRNIIVDLLPGLDSIDVALAAIVDESIKTGIEMIKSSFVTALDKWGLKPISPLGSEFDPLECEACLFEESSEVENETVSEILQVGYILNGKIIRPAKVKIKKPVS